MSSEQAISPMSSVFICHASRDERFALGLAAYLKRYLAEVFCFEDQQRSDGSFVVTINEKIGGCKVFVTIVGETVTDWQILEAASACQPQGGRSFFTVTLPDSAGTPYKIPEKLLHLRNYPIIQAEGHDQGAIRSVAAKIVEKLHLPLQSADLPLNPHLFSYEKDIVAFFVKARLEKIASSAVSAEDRQEIREKILQGCPQEWPQVVKWTGDLSSNLLSSDDVGIWRKESARVLTTGLVSEETLPIVAGSEQEIAALRRLDFPEAGPRENLYFPKEEQVLRVAILVSGGIAPGINAVIDGIVQRHWLYAEKHGYRDGLTLMGLRNGFRSFDSLVNNNVLLAGSSRHYPDKPRLETWNHVNEGGSILGTSRVDELIDPDRRESELKKIVGILKNERVDILYVIGGDGSMKAAHALWNIAQTERGRSGPPLSVVAIPKTMDNDILWVWQSFGFLSAVEKAREVIEQLNTEVRSNPRLCIAQLFGSESGFVVSHAVLASGTGHCDLALIPEIEFSMEKIAQHLTDRMSQSNQHIPHGLVVLAETAIPNDAFRYVGPPGGSPDIDIGLSTDEKKAIRDFFALKRRVQGQTNDALRTAGLKIVSRGLEQLLPHKKKSVTDWSKLRVFTNEPRHLLRAIPPSSSDIIIGHRLGTLAVDNAMAGYTDFMISQWLTEYVLVPLELVVLGRKRIPQEGIFWKSVLAKTGQPAKLT